MFFGINMFLGFLRPHFNLHYPRAKMSAIRAKNISVMSANINCIVILALLTHGPKNVI